MNQYDVMERGQAENSPRTDSSMSPYRPGSWCSTLKSSLTFFSGPKSIAENPNWPSRLGQLWVRFTSIATGQHSRAVRSPVYVQKCT
jgi:hypothetical protein